MPEPKTFVADDPDLDGTPFPIAVEFRRFTGPEDDNGKRPSERVTETYQCRPFVNAGVLVYMDTIMGRKIAPGEMQPLFDMFDAAILPTDQQRFRDMIHSPDTYVDGKTIGSIASYMYEVYTARPTQPPAGT